MTNNEIIYSEVNAKYHTPEQRRAILALAYTPEQIAAKGKEIHFQDVPEEQQGEELEKLLGKCDAIKECIVKEMGKKIGTVVCCEDDRQQQVKAFVTELNRTLPMYKRISVVECSAEPLPRNALGKLLRR